MNNPKQEMTAMDWVQLIADAKLQGQRWGWTFGTGLLRNEHDECPLCALANTVGYGDGISPPYKSAFIQALRGAFGEDVDTTAAPEIAAAADRRHAWDTMGVTQQALFKALGLDSFGRPA